MEHLMGTSLQGLWLAAGNMSEGNSLYIPASIMVVGTFIILHSLTGCHTKAEELSQLCYLLRVVGIMPFQRVLAWSEMQTA